MTKGNKGEWSELYVLLYLLATQKLYAADDHGRKIKDMYYPVLKILRKESIGKIDYYLGDDNRVEIFVNGEKRKSVPVCFLEDYAAALLNAIKAGNGLSFSIHCGDAIMKEVLVSRLTAPSTDKTDITMQLHDVNTGIDPIVGFSIKSELGSPPTLLNASGATNFVYKIDGLMTNDMFAINSIDTRTKILDRIEYIYSAGCKLEYICSCSKTFSSNLMMIDSRMEEIVATMLIYFYRYGTANCKDLLSLIEKENPLRFPQSGFYTFKFKKLLCAIALGMKPSVPWDGIDEANGGYILVKENGNVLAYHIYNRNFFEQYLFDNTKLERASTSRHDYAHVYIGKDGYQIKLNLQIRFV